MINIFNPFEEKYFNKKSIANKEDKNVVIRPTKRGKKPNEKKSLKEEINSTIAARKIAGIPKIPSYGKNTSKLNSSGQRCSRIINSKKKRYNF